jgi:CDP-4-dehydro-6-deoxyglucose reductase
MDPKRPGEFELGVSNDGGKGLLAEIAPGKTLFVSSPAGSFVWQRRSSSTLLIGIGTGVAPLRAMLQAALDFETERSVTLLYGARSEAEILWNAEFVHLSRAESRFRFEPTLSQAGPHWQGRRGRVQDHLAELASDVPDASVYICGKTSMVADSIALLLDLGIDPERVSSEAH